jgi:hypothetical protein
MALQQHAMNAAMRLAREGEMASRCVDAREGNSAKAKETWAVDMSRMSRKDSPRA